MTLALKDILLVTADLKETVMPFGRGKYWPQSDTLVTVEPRADLVSRQIDKYMPALILWSIRDDKSSLTEMHTLNNQRPGLPLVGFLERKSSYLTMTALSHGALEVISRRQFRQEVLDEVRGRVWARLQSIEHLHNAMNRCRAILDYQISMICCFDLRLTITFANSALCSAFGQSLDHITGRHIDSLWDRETCHSLMEELIKLTPEQPFLHRTITLKPHERSNHHRWTFRAIFDQRGLLHEFQAVGQDYTNQYAVNNALRMASSNLYYILNSPNDSILLLDLDGNIVFANTTARVRYKQSLMLTRKLELQPYHGLCKELLLETDQGLKTIELRTHDTIWCNQKAYLAFLRDVTDQARYRDDLNKQSFLDEMTQLYNRRGFMNVAEQQLKMSRRYHYSLLLFFMDVDGLKNINDTLGHHVGDQALLAVSDILRMTFRESDVLARLGGDEFVVLTHSQDQSQEQMFLERLHSNIDMFRSRHSPVYNLSLSVGTARYDPQQPLALEDLLNLADAGMYKGKIKKRRRVHIPFLPEDEDMDRY